MTPDREYPEVIPAQEHPIGSMAWILAPCTTREKIVLLAYYLGGMSAQEIGEELVNKLDREARTPGPAAVRKHIRSGRSKIYAHVNIEEKIDPFRR